MMENRGYVSMEKNVVVLVMVIMRASDGVEIWWDGDEGGSSSGGPGCVRWDGDDGGDRAAIVTVIRMEYDDGCKYE